MTDLLKELAEAEAALVFVDEQGIIRFWNRTHLAKTQPTAHTFSYSNLTNLQIKSTPVINSAQVVAKPFKVQAFQKLWELEQGSEQTKIKAGKTIDIFAEFPADWGVAWAYGLHPHAPGDCVPKPMIEFISGSGPPSLAAMVINLPTTDRKSVV